VLHKVIATKQSALLKNRGLIDSVVVANECMDEVKRKKENCMVFKVDFEEEYN